MFLQHSVIVQNQDPAADAVLNFDLGVNPLSMILIALRPLNDTGTLSNFQRWFGICESLNRIDLRHRGQNVLSMGGGDAAAMAVLRHGYQPWMANADSTNNERLCAVLPIFLGRAAYDSKSCFPATRKGELTLSLDVDVASAGYDDLQFTIETVELMGANPSEYERKVQLAQTLGSTGINDLDLPLGNLLRGMLLFGTTGFAGASPAPSWGRISLVADGVGVAISNTDWEVQHAMTGLRAAVPVDDHIHTENDTGGPTDEAHNWGVSYTGRTFIDLDPTHDDAFAIDSSKVSRLQIRADAETADAVRIIPVERIKA